MNPGHCFGRLEIGVGVGLFEKAAVCTSEGGGGGVDVLYPRALLLLVPLQLFLSSWRPNKTSPLFFVLARMIWVSCKMSPFDDRFES